MNKSDRKRWLRAVALLGALYFLTGTAFGAFAASAALSVGRETWNRLAFLVCGIAFAGHIGYEHYRLGSLPRITAWHAAIAVAIGAFALALAANIHDLGSAAGYRPRMLIAFLAWPLLTGVPAFFVAWVTAAGLNLSRRST